MKVLTYHLHLLEPVLATQPHSGEANSGVSLPFIPGSMIRGAVIAAYSDRQREKNLAGREETRRLFFDGTVNYLNTYLRDIEVPSNAQPHPWQRLLPRPTSWRVPKDETDSAEVCISDFAWGVTDIKRPKAPEGDFCRLSQGVVSLRSPEWHVSVHNFSLNRNKKVGGSNQVYRYEALDGGQTFVGLILAEKEADLKTIETHLKNISFVGGSHTGGYGHVEVTQTHIGDWPGEYETEGTGPGDKIIITLLSDAIVRGSDGQVGGPNAFLHTLNVDLQTPYKAFQRVTQAGGFNRTWGLPLPQTWAVQAGAVYVFPAGTISPAALQRALTFGIGERRLDGFGRIAVNWHSQAQLQQVHPKAAAALPVKVTLTSSSQALAQQIANRLLQQTLEKKLVSVLSRITGHFQGLPSTSQLSRVRVAARHALLGNDGTENPIVDHLESLRGAAADWRDTRLHGQPLTEWLKETSQMNEGMFREQFGLTDSMPQVAGQSARLTDNIRHTYCYRLIDGVMKLAIEEKKRQGGDR